ncbi:MAG: aldolase/citrate lyase family protein [Gammaproteobacteria bacterium]|jgi:2-keto-3-deoxy-L-rhamnonate aldolase RhmA
MKRNDFRARLLGGETLIGTLLNLPSAAVAEVLATAEFDWLFVDTEHGAIGTSALLSILQAVDRDLACIVRVPELGAGAIKRVLDLGAHGIIVPQVESETEAAEAVRLARYAPAGERGMGLGRAHAYGASLNEYIATANDTISVIVQAEHALAVENIEGIATVEGLDAVFLGPYDLSASLGHPGEIDHPVVVEAIEHVTEACRAAGMPLGYFGVDAHAVAPYMERGFTLICASVDCLLLGQGARRLVRDLRPADGGKSQ